MRLRLLLVTAALVAPALRAQQAQPPAYHGNWHGPMLFVMLRESAPPQQAPAVHELTLTIADDGSVRGRVAGAGCQLSGSAADFVSAANASLDIHLAGCHDPRFNGRFTGRLIGNPALNYASLRLALTRSPGSDTAQVSAILRR